jgi:3-oxoacyl-[acyl-carrier protein] reductase
MRSKIAVVTGAGAGIGAAIAARLSADGYEMVAVDIDASSAETTVSRIRSSGGAASSIQMDAGNPCSVAEGFAEISVRHGRCDVLVSNAGIAGKFPFLELPLEHWSRVMSVNVTGVMLCGQHAARLMAAQHTGGCIVNLASVAGMRASPGRAAYGTSKAAIIALTRQMAIELIAHGIRVNAVAPGPIETPMVQHFHSAAARASFVRGVPSGRYGMATEVAAAVSFLVSDQASYTTGHVLAVDGGLHAAGLMDV